MSPTRLTSERHILSFAQAFAEHWGFEEEPLRKHLIGQMKQMALAELEDDKKVVEALLTKPAIEYRNRMLRPILQGLSDWLGAQLSHRLGSWCQAFRDDAASQTLMTVLDYWEPRWSSSEGQEHLRRYALVVARHTAFRLFRGEKARESRLPPRDDAQFSPDAETLSIEQAEERQRGLAQSKLRTLEWLLLAGLPQTEASAVSRRLLGPAATAHLERRAEAASRKAYQRGKARLLTKGDLLREGRAPGPLGGASPWCVVEHLGLRGRFQVVECTSCDLRLEGSLDEACLEIGANCLVHIHSNSAVIARCVCIERTDGKFRITLELLFQERSLPDIGRSLICSCSNRGG